MHILLLLDRWREDGLGSYEFPENEIKIFDSLGGYFNKQAVKSKDIWFQKIVKIAEGNWEMRRNSSLIYILVSLTLACKVIYIILTSWLLAVTFSLPIPNNENLHKICISICLLMVPSSFEFQLSLYTISEGDQVSYFHSLCQRN